MSKFVRIKEAAFYLNTTPSNIMVSASVYRKNNGGYPCWYKSDGNIGATKSYIDIDYLLSMREMEMSRFHESCNLFYFITETMGIKQSHLAPLLAQNSPIYNKRASWMSFMQTTLFCEPATKFNNRVTRLQEFHRICGKLVEEYNAKYNSNI